MTEDSLLSNLKSIIGLKILAVKYIQTEFHYDLNGNWDNTNPDSFLLHGKAWILTLSNNQNYYLFNSSKNLSISNNIIKGELTNVPNDFYWKDLIGKEFTAFRLWKRVSKSTSLFGLIKQTEYAENINIIELALENMTLCFSIMNGDIGQSSFYPTGYISDSLGVFFNKQIVESHTVNHLTMDMEVIYDSIK